MFHLVIELKNICSATIYQALSWDPNFITFNNLILFRDQKGGNMTLAAVNNG